jgi:hypothetical protein
MIIVVRFTTLVVVLMFLRRSFEETLLDDPNNWLNCSNLRLLTLDANRPIHRKTIGFDDALFATQAGLFRGIPVTIIRAVTAPKAAASATQKQALFDHVQKLALIQGHNGVPRIFGYCFDDSNLLVLQESLQPWSVVSTTQNLEWCVRLHVALTTTSLFQFLEGDDHDWAAEEQNRDTYAFDNDWGASKTSYTTVLCDFDANDLAFTPDYEAKLLNLRHLRLAAPSSMPLYADASCAFGDGSSCSRQCGGRIAKLHAALGEFACQDGHCAGFDPRFNAFQLCRWTLSKLLNPEQFTRTTATPPTLAHELDELLRRCLLLHRRERASLGDVHRRLVALMQRHRGAECLAASGVNAAASYYEPRSCYLLLLLLLVLSSALIVDTYVVLTQSMHLQHVAQRAFALRREDVALWPPIPIAIGRLAATLATDDDARRKQGTKRDVYSRFNN